MKAKLCSPPSSFSSSARLIVEIDKTSSNSVGPISLSLSCSQEEEKDGEVISTETTVDFRSEGEKLTAAVDSSGHLGGGRIPPLWWFSKYALN